MCFKTEKRLVHLEMYSEETGEIWAVPAVSEQIQKRVYGGQKKLCVGKYKRNKGDLVKIVDEILEKESLHSG